MIVKNNSGQIKTWCGQEIADQGTYTIQAIEEAVWRGNDTVINDIASGALLVSDGVSYLSAANGLRLMMGNAVEVVKQTGAQQPFAEPTYRTKRNATANLVTINPGDTGEILFQMTAERYVSGGALIVKNAQIGDYVYAEVEDIDGVIPAPYRAALCEAWPVVAKYIEKEWVKIESDTYTCHEINTYPLNAKITAGLYLSLHYVAVNSGSAREVGVNYYLTKKL